MPIMMMNRLHGNIATAGWDGTIRFDPQHPHMIANPIHVLTHERLHMLSPMRKSGGDAAPSYRGGAVHVEEFCAEHLTAKAHGADQWLRDRHGTVHVRDEDGMYNGTRAYMATIASEVTAQHGLGTWKDAVGRLTDGAVSFWRDGSSYSAESHVSQFAQHVFKDKPEAARDFAARLTELGKTSSEKLESDYAGYIGQVRAVKAGGGKVAALTA